MPDHKARLSLGVKQKTQIKRSKRNKKSMESHSHIDAVIQEVEQALDLTTKVQSLVKLGNCSDALRESTRALSEEILQTCNATLSLLDSWKKKTNYVKPPKKRTIEFGSQGFDVVPSRRNLLRRNYARKEVTAVPYNDGHQWRKYGEKIIKGSTFPRSYYRCTYSEDKKCQAKKQVQQKNCGAPSLFLVIYEGEHTCNSLSTSDDVQRMLQGSEEIKQAVLTKGYTKDQPFSVLNKDGEHKCNNNAAVLSPPAGPFLLQFDSKEFNKEGSKDLIPSSHKNSTVIRKDNNEGRTNELKGEKLCSSLSVLELADLTFDESMDGGIALDQVFSPSSIVDLTWTF